MPRSNRKAIRECEKTTVALERLRAEWAQEVPLHQTDAALELAELAPDEYRRLFGRDGLPKKGATE